MWLLIPIALVVAVVIAAVVAAGLVIAGVGWVVIGMLHHLPWLLVLMGVWLVFRSRGPRHRRAWSGGPGSFDRYGSWGGSFAGPTPSPRRDAPSEPAASRGAAATGTAAAAVADRPAASARPRRELPIDLRVKVEQIRHKADVLQGYAERFPPFSHELHLVRQTAADYLPRTVNAYLSLPGDEDLVVRPSGKTALEELREQLSLLDVKLDEIAQDLQRQDVDRLLANRQFLEDRFHPRGAEGQAGTQA